MTKVRISTIKRVVTEYYGITTEELEGFRRFQVIARPRRVAMYLAYDIAGLTFEKVGKAFGGRTRQMAFEIFRKVRREIAADPRGACEVDKLRRVCQAWERRPGAIRLHRDRSRPEPPGQYVKRTFKPAKAVVLVPASDLTGIILGDPAPGRSALSQALKGK